ncbi:DNA topoisomerase 3 [Burkholderia multivorans]|uniref:DNA topoisomerase 3 n=1 Tax=Burkholderia multivorans TaxID=87883 RepID=UPI001C25064F|nr:DNA topoisomerase 3 [Burkholderia multivorans]MBU9363483.1 DNA topoisomerase 3 [Burkholderia multivorans]
MKLFICEKPSQAKDLAPHIGARGRIIGAFTGNDVTLTWCIGHLVEQAKPEQYVPALARWRLDLLPVLPRQWAVQVKPSVKAQFDIVVRLIRKAGEIVIATDADREGEVIAREMMQIAGYHGPVSRLWLSAMDAASIRTALTRLLPGAKTLPLYLSGQGRAHADWLAGMNLTMALTTAFGTGGREGTWHVGRVQTPVLALVVRRERAIRAFVPKTFYELRAVFSLAGTALSMQWVVPQRLADEVGHATDEAAVRALAARVHERTGRVERVATTPEREVPPLPFSLGSLQREASARYGLKAATVLDACQALYETHKVATYPRTDCEHLPISMFTGAPAILSAIASVDATLRPLADQAMLDSPGRAFNDAKITAHHAIIPTASSAVRLSALSRTERIVYGLICHRYLAQFLGDYEYLQTVIEVACEGELFRVMGATPTTSGWRRILEVEKGHPATDTDDETINDEAVKSEASALPVVRKGQPAPNVSCEVERRRTRPPKRYTEGTLLAAMESIDREITDERLKKIMRTKEKAGIGTDATRAGIIENLFHRKYIGNHAKQKKQIVPLQRGDALIALLERVVPELVDPVLTAEWEDRLLQIEAGQLELAQFDADLGAWIGQLVAHIRDQRGTVIDGSADGAPSPGVTCPACGAPMRRIKGSRGYFWGCAAYREGCRSTLPDANGVPVARDATTAARDVQGGKV